MRKTRESCICFSLALGGEIFANMHCEEFALLFTNTRAMGGADNQCGAGIMVYVVVLHVASLHGNCTLHIYHFQALDSVQSALEACVVSFTAVCLELAFIGMLGKLCLRNRKHVPCFYRVIQGSYGSWKTWKVLEFHYGIFQDWKVLEKGHWSWKVLEICETQLKI